MSEEKINSEDGFEREMRLCEDFHYHDSTDDAIISFNISSEEMNILVYYNKNWNAERGTVLLNTFLRRRKLDLIGYLPWQMIKYPSAEWHKRKKPCQYTSLCPKFNFDMYFYDNDFRIYDGSYDSWF